MIKKIRNIEELSEEIERQKDEYLKNGGDLELFKPDFYSNGLHDMSYGHFPNVFLEGQCLRKVTFNNADLTGANLAKAYLHDEEEKTDRRDESQEESHTRLS